MTMYLLTFYRAILVNCKYLANQLMTNEQGKVGSMTVAQNVTFPLAQLALVPRSIRSVIH